MLYYLLFELIELSIKLMLKIQPTSKKVEKHHPRGKILYNVLSIQREKKSNGVSVK